MAKEVTVRKDTAEVMIAQAIEKGVPVDVMERLLAMRTQIKQEQAKEAFDRAMAQFQAECPTIKKTKEVRGNNGQVAYKYAPIESIVSQVKDALRANGFSYSTSMQLMETGVKVTVKVIHAEGHSETSEMEVPFGNKTQIMSQTQVAAAATTFAKRYAFCNAFGILTGDEDTDAAPEREPMKPYAVARVVPEEDDEAQGKRRNVGPIKEIDYPAMTPATDTHALDNPKDAIKRILDEKFNKRPKTVGTSRAEIKELTGKLWLPGHNDNDVLEALQKKEK